MGKKSAFKEGLEYLGKGFYGTVKLMFELPTFIRRMALEQTLFWELDPPSNRASAADLGNTIGFGVGGTILWYCINEASRNNYVPLAILAATNIKSGLDELSRLHQTKKEYLDTKIYCSEDIEKIQKKHDRFHEEYPFISKD